MKHKRRVTSDDKIITPGSQPGDSVLIQFEATAKLIKEQQELERDAERWRALISSDRIRILGTAGLNNTENKKQHFGMEIWDRFRPEENFSKDNKYGVRVITEYVDTMIKNEKLNDIEVNVDKEKDRLLRGRSKMDTVEELRKKIDVLEEIIELEVKQTHQWLDEQKAPKGEEVEDPGGIIAEYGILGRCEELLKLKDSEISKLSKQVSSKEDTLTLIALILRNHSHSVFGIDRNLISDRGIVQALKDVLENKNVKT